MMKPEAIEAPQRPADVDIVEELRAAGVEQPLTSKMFDYVDDERAKAMAEAARLFYCRDDEQE